MVNEGLAEISSVMGMHSQTGTFIHKQNMVVFVDNVQLGIGNGQISVIFPGLVEKFVVDVQLQHIADLQPGVPVNALAVAFDSLQPYVFLSQGSGQQRNRFRKKTIQTLTGVVGSDSKFFHNNPCYFMFSSKCLLICSVNSSAAL